MAEPLEKIVGGKYEILGKLKEGGMGSIYQVRHRLLDEVRVIKVLKPHLALQEDLRLRFHNEAKAAIRLRHPNIAHLYDFSIDDRGNAYIVMEYIDGVTLQELLAKSGPPSLPLGLEIGRQCLQAVAYLHRSGFVHRDIAADNFMLTRDFRDEPLVKLIDLGIAKSQSSDLDLTSAGVFMGKVRYAAPEQFAKDGGAAKMGPRSDLYSFGVLLYQLLTGSLPIAGESFSEIVAGHLFRPPLGFDESDPEGKVPEGLRAVVLRAMEKNPASRFATAGELLAELSTYLEPGGSKKEEFTRTLQITTSRLEREPEVQEPGSTQSRLDREFGLEVTPSHREMDEADAAIEGTAGAAAIEPTRHPASIPPDAGAKKDAGMAPPRRARVGRRLLLAALLMFLVAGAASLWLLVRPPRFERAAMRAEELRVAAATRWTEDAAGAPFDSTRFPAEPPPLPPETAEESAPEEPGTGKSSPGSSLSDRGGGAVESAIEEAEPEASPEPVEEPAEPTPAAAIGPAPLYTAGPGVTPPKLLQLPEPVLPRDVKAPSDDLEVELRVLVDERGKVANATVTKAPAFRRRFKEAALGAAYRATFEPAVRDRRPGKMWTELTVVFPGARIPDPQ